RNLNVSPVHSRPSLSRPEERPRRDYRIPKVPRSSRNRAELPARFARPPPTCPRLCDGRRHRQSEECLPGLLRPLERRRLRRPHPERSQGGVREAAITSSCTCGCCGKDPAQCRLLPPHFSFADNTGGTSFIGCPDPRRLRPLFSPPTGSRSAFQKADAAFHNS